MFGVKRNICNDSWLVHCPKQDIRQSRKDTHDVVTGLPCPTWEQPFQPLHFSSSEVIWLSYTPRIHEAFLLSLLRLEVLLRGRGQAVYARFSSTRCNKLLLQLLNLRLHLCEGGLHRHGVLRWPKPLAVPP